MTLGCGAPGGNITSDNIGPQHLLNVKRIAWESQPVEHRTVPAEQRLSGQAQSQAAAASASAAATERAPISQPAADRPSCAGPAKLPPPSQIASDIAARVFAAAAGAETVSPASRESAVPDAVAPVTPVPQPALPAAPAPAVSPFVSESDVRLAMARHEKILIGPRSIVTPSARDLGTAHEVFVETGAS
jgi:hypothetical protein